MSIRVYSHELKILADDLEAEPRHVLNRVERVTGNSIERIRRVAAGIIRAGNYAHLPHLARSFTADTEVDRAGSRVVGEAGAEHALLQGRLDVYIEYGTPTSPDHPHWRPASDREVPRWIDNLEDACAEGFE